MKLCEHVILGDCWGTLKSLLSSGMWARMFLVPYNIGSSAVCCAKHVK